ncbi:MAG TPA: adenylosuccinate lyase [Chitinophagaceae bacterium]|nr:adenylosuccinate lyase [Chitinophagaceae bacterium]
MELQNLTAISPLDGRYRNQLNYLANYFSEYALMRFRVYVEIEYFIALSEEKLFPLTAVNKKALRSTYENFDIDKAIEIKNLESVTNHDVKAVEYFLKKQLDFLQLSHLKEWVHFGLTSQDINNTAIPLLWKEVMENEFFPSVTNFLLQLKKLAVEWKDIALLARTHGQPASPTRLGKEIMVFVERTENQLNLLSQIPFSAKFGGATGNFNAHAVAYPGKNWIKFANNFLEKKLGLQRQHFTTQIEHYDNLAAQFDGIKRINTILIDFCRDMWAYISMDYFKQKIKKGEIGSSAMPHKVNPIDFENAEGNFGLANALFEHLSAKLPISRLQRDLTDSTVLRNIGVPFSHSALGLLSLIKGINKLLLNESKIKADLENNWAVIAEAIQTVLRRENYPLPYEALKNLTRGKNVVNKKTIHKFINGLKVSVAIKKELKAISPHNYTGIYPKY